MNKDVFDSDRGDLGDQDTAESVCDRGVDANEGEGGSQLVVAVEFDREGIAKLLDVPGVVFAGPVARKVG